LLVTITIGYVDALSRLSVLSVALFGPMFSLFLLYCIPSQISTSQIFQKVRENGEELLRREKTEQITTEGGKKEQRKNEKESRQAFMCYGSGE